MSSPDTGAAILTNQLASATASPGTVLGRAKWYAPTLMPWAFAWARFVAYMLSMKSMSSDAFR